MAISQGVAVLLNLHASSSCEAQLSSGPACEALGGVCAAHSHTQLLWPQPAAYQHKSKAAQASASSLSAHALKPCNAMRQGWQAREAGAARGQVIDEPLTAYRAEYQQA